MQTGLCACKGSDGTWENCVQGHPLPSTYDHVAPGDIDGVVLNPDDETDPPPVANPSVAPPTKAPADSPRVTTPAKDQEQDTNTSKGKKAKKGKKGGKGRKK